MVLPFIREKVGIRVPAAKHRNQNTGYLQLQREIKPKHVAPDSRMEMKDEIAVDEYPLSKVQRLGSAGKLLFPIRKAQLEVLTHVILTGHNFIA